MWHFNWMQELMAGEVPQAVLAERLADVIAGRKIRAAVFTTFSFDPGFFELHVLPTLFDLPFSQVEKVKRIQLEDALRTVEDVAVYFDRTALSQDALPAQLDFRRIGVRGPNGIFHPKLVLVLVENPTEDDDSFRGPETLIVGCLSANLTRGGWWENLEVGHFESIEDKEWTNERNPFRKDLLAVTRRIVDLGGPPAEQKALRRIREFLLKRASTQAPAQHSAQGIHYTRLFYGQSDLPAWLSEIRVANGEWNLEVISPYFDAEHSGTLERLIDEVEPRETRIYLPCNLDGSAKVTAKLYDAISKLANWSTLPGQLTRPGARAAKQDAAPRFVHAKVYRFWRSDGKQIVLVGSVNLTNAAHSRVGAGNLEASFLVDVSEDGIPKRWWLQRIETEPNGFSNQDPAEDTEQEDVFVDLSIRFDWHTNCLSYRLESVCDGGVVVCDPSGRELFSIERPALHRWIKCQTSASEAVRELLVSTSFLQIVHPKGTWRVLVREEGIAFRPSLLSTLTPDEILMYWSLLSDAQREAFIMEKLAGEGDLQGLTTRTYRYSVQDTFFDRFAGVYHAFEQLYRHVTDCIDRDEVRGAEARLFGAKYDSLPELLQKTFDNNDDPVMRYIMFLCAKQIAERVRRHSSEFWKTHQKERARLESLLSHLPALADALPLDDDDRVEFLDWYETMFVRMIRQPEEIA
jgi:hypothetical protein